MRAGQPHPGSARHHLLALGVASARTRDADRAVGGQRAASACSQGRARDRGGALRRPQRGPATPVEVLRNSSIERSATYDLARDEWTYVTESLGGLFGEGVLRLTEIDT